MDKHEIFIKTLVITSSTDIKNTFAWMNNSFTEMGSLKPGFLTRNFLGRSALGVLVNRKKFEYSVSRCNNKLPLCTNTTD